MVFKKGKLWYDGAVKPSTPRSSTRPWLNRPTDTFHLPKLKLEDFRDPRPRAVIGLVDSEIVTTDNGYATKVDLEQDILKIAVVERHKSTGHIGVGYIQGYGLKRGAVATSISMTATISSS